MRAPTTSVSDARRGHRRGRAARSRRSSARRATRPRISSGAPRWTSTWLQTIAHPLPDGRDPGEHGRDGDRRRARGAARSRRPSARASRRRPSSSRACRAPSRRRSCRRRARRRSRATSTPSPTLPAPSSSFAKHDLGDVDPRRRDTPPCPRRARTVSSGREWTTSPSPSRDVAPVAARERLLRLQLARRDPRDERPPRRGT